jgi:hypothetical protein
MARREHCVQCRIATAACQPTAPDFCRQCGRSTDLERVATVDMDVMAVTKTPYERATRNLHKVGAQSRL